MLAMIIKSEAYVFNTVLQGAIIKTERGIILVLSNKELTACQNASAATYLIWG